MQLILKRHSSLECVEFSALVKGTKLCPLFISFIWGGRCLQQPKVRRGNVSLRTKRYAAYCLLHKGWNPQSQGSCCRRQSIIHVGFSESPRNVGLMGSQQVESWQFMLLSLLWIKKKKSPCVWPGNLSSVSIYETLMANWFVFEWNETKPKALHQCHSTFHTLKHFIVLAINVLVQWLYLAPREIHASSTFSRKTVPFCLFTLLPKILMSLGWPGWKT